MCDLAGRRIHFLFLSGIYGLGFLYIAWRHFKNIQSGGDPYLQGDWLMNHADGVVRRGLSGEVFLWLSDLFDAPVVVVLGIFQIAVLAAIIATLLAVAFAKGPSARLLLVLLSPALVLFWVNDLYTPFRKELLAYFAFVPLLLPRTGAVAGWRVGASVFLFLLAVAFQEANAVFAAPLGLTFWLLLERQQALVAIVLTGSIAVASSVFAYTFQSVPNVDGMCARLLQEGVNPAVCDGDAPILWLVWTVSEVVEEGRKLILFESSAPFLRAGLTVGVILTALLYLLHPFWRLRRYRLVLLAVVAAIFPLFFLGSDWGRFVSYTAFSLLFVTLAISDGDEGATFSKPVPPLIFFAILAVHLCVGFWHMLPEPTPGFVQVIATAILRFAT